MANQVIIPSCNPVQFYWTERPVPIGKNQFFLGEDWYEKQVPDWYQKIPYLQKWQKSDTIAIRLKTSFGSASWTIIDCSGNALADGDMDLVQDVPPNQLYYYYKSDIQLAIPELPADRQFYIVLSVGVGADLATWISEPQIVSLSFPDTRLVRFTAPRGDYFDSWFSEDDFLSIRVEGNVNAYQPGSNTKISIGIDQDVYFLSGVPFDQYSFQIGGKYGVPAWMAKKLNTAFCFPYWEIDYKQFVKAANDSAFEANRLVNYPMAGYTISIRPASNTMYDFSDSEFNTEVAVAYNIQGKVFGTINNMLPSDATIQIIKSE